MTDDRVDAALERLGAAPVEPPSATFADALEQRLRYQHAAGVGSAPAPLGAPGRPLARRVAIMAAAAAAAVAVGVSLVADPAADTVVLVSASDATVVLPDGSVVEATAGLELPEGALIITGDAGAAEVAGIDIPRDSLAVVEGGRVRLLEPESPPTTGVDSPTTTTTQPEVPTTAGTTSTRPPSATTTTEAPSATTTAAERPRVVELTLTADRITRREVTLRWSGYRGADFDRYVLVRTLSDGDAPPPDPGTSAAAVFTSRSAETQGFRDGLPEGTAHAKYRVIVLDRDNDVVGLSSVARV